jgi:MFS family permease
VGRVQRHTLRRLYVGSVAAPVTLRSLGPTVYLPSTIYAVGQGAVNPVIVLSGTALGASPAIASALVGLMGLGQIAGAVPSGRLIAAIGERRAMVLATGIAVPALLACVFAQSVWVLGAGVTVLGLSGAVWGVARHTYVTEVVAYEMRARALSTLGGVARIGIFAGPFIGAAMMAIVGLPGAYWVHAAAAAIATALLIILPATAHDRPASLPLRSREVIGANLTVLRTLGIGVLLVGAMRASRQTVVPLWGANIGLDATTLSIIYGVSGGIDMLLFYPAGKVMDRYGRRWVSIPSIAILTFAHAVLPLARSVAGLAAAAMLMGLGNGLSSGLVMTLGADVSPAAGRPQFLGAWRLLVDLGTGAGPLLIGAVLAFWPLPVAVLTMAGAGAASVAALYRWTPRSGMTRPVRTRPNDDK